jgi:hypothetical protein
MPDAPRSFPALGDAAARAARCARALALALPLLLAACFSVGRPFPGGPIPSLEPGRSTQEDVRRAFGPPWRVGLTDGQRTWTYGHYRYSLFGANSARDLVCKFDERGVLISYDYSSTERDR